MATQTLRIETAWLVDLFVTKKAKYSVIAKVKILLRLTSSP